MKRHAGRQKQTMISATAVLAAEMAWNTAASPKGTHTYTHAHTHTRRKEIRSRMQSSKSGTSDAD